MAAPSSSIHHIDRDRLHEDVIYRFQYLQRFVEFGAHEIEAIKAVGVAIVPLAPTIVDLVYKKLFAFDITKEVFLRRNEGYTGTLAADVQSLDMNNGQIKFRKDMLTKYITKLVTADYDANFVKYLDWVGKVHTPKSGSKSINVDFVHCMALFAYISDIILSAILELPIDNDTKKRSARAFNKLFWIQAELFSRHYVSADAEHKMPVASAAPPPVASGRH